MMTVVALVLPANNLAKIAAKTAVFSHNRKNIDRAAFSNFCCYLIQLTLVSTTSSVCQ